MTSSVAGIRIGVPYGLINPAWQVHPYHQRQSRDGEGPEEGGSKNTRHPYPAGDRSGDIPDAGRTSDTDVIGQLFASAGQAAPDVFSKITKIEGPPTGNKTVTKVETVRLPARIRARGKLRRFNIAAERSW